MRIVRWLRAVFGPPITSKDQELDELTERVRERYRRLDREYNDLMETLEANRDR